MDERLRRELKTLEKRKLQARNVGDLAEEAKLCNVAGELLAEHRLFESAIEEHNKELHLSESLNDLISIAISHRKLGECLCECKDFRKALFHQQKYLELSQESHDLVEEQRAYATLGRTYFQLAESNSDTSDMEKAQTAFTKSLFICDQLREIVKEKELLEMRARLYLNLGLVNDNLNNKKESMKLIEKALVIAVNQSLKDTEYRCHFSLGDIKLSEGRPAEALQCFEKARKVAQHQKKKFDEADTLVQMGKALLSLGDFKSGKNILKRCLEPLKHGDYVEDLRSSLIKAIKGTKLLEKLQIYKDHEGTLIRVYEDLGDIFSQVKCYPKAIHYYHKQLELSEKLKKSNKEKAVICVSLAYSYADNKQYDKAKEYFLDELALREGESDEQCDTWCNIAKVTETSGDGYEDIEEAYRNAVECAKNAQKPEKQVRVLKLLAEVQKKLSKVERLKKTLNEISCLEDCKMEEDSEENEEESQEEEIDKEEEERLIEEEMEHSDEESDEDEDGQLNAGRVRRTNTKAINKRNEKGETVLHCAAIRGDYNLAKTSIEKGVSVNARDYCGWQPLHEACNHGHVDIVELLLQYGADINDPGGPHCCGMTPLHDATVNGHVAVVKLLVERGANVNLKNRDGQTPLDQVLKAIADDEEDSDDRDPELSQIREELKTILGNTMGSTKTDTNHLLEMKRRDHLDLIESSDEEQCSDVVTETNHVSTNANKLSRKRKSVMSDLDSEDDSEDGGRPRFYKKSDQQVVGNVTKIPRISKNNEYAILSDSESLDHEELWEGSASVMKRENDFSERVLSKDVLSNLSEDQSDVSEENELSPSQASRKAYWEKSSGSSHNVHLLDEDPPETWNNELSVSRKTNSWNTDGSSPASRHGTSLPNNDRNHKSSPKFVDPLTGITEQEAWSSSTPALIPESEFSEGISAAQGWLIDDMPRRAGKRKRSGDIRRMLGSSERQKKLPQVSGSRVSRTKNAHSSLKQSRLSNHVVSGRSVKHDTWDSEVSDSPEPAGSPRPSIPSATVSKVMDFSAPMRVRVKVKDKTFCIPCSTATEEKKTVRWLAELATLRYYTVCGLKPVLSLSTAEGAFLSPDDEIKDVLSNNEQVIASVESWDLPPLVERYKTACMSVNTYVHKPVLELLQSNPHSSNVDLLDMALTPAMLLPLFRALQCHDQLVKLSLPGNRMGDIGFQHLVAALPCLPNLAAIILSSNGITHKGLRHLASTLDEDSQTSKIWMGLKELDISFNPVKDISAPSLATILCSCLLLQKLDIQSCNLTGSTFQQRSVFVEAMSGLTRLRHLRISHNMINSDGLRPLLNALSCSPLEMLDVSYTTIHYDPAFGNVLAEYLDMESCCIQELVCQGCFLRDNDAAILARSCAFLKTIVKLDFGLNEIGQQGAMDLASAIESSQCPKQLDLSGNFNVTNLNLLQFLTPTNGKYIQRLNLSLCGLTSPLPTEFEKLQTFSASGILKFLNLSHNSIEENDQEKLSVWWNSVWGKHSQICLNPPFIIFTIHNLPG